MTADAMTLARPDIGTTIRNYISLTKPRIILLLLVTTVPAMVVAHHGFTDAPQQGCGTAQRVHPDTLRQHCRTLPTAT